MKYESFTKNASDLIKIADVFGGYPAKEVMMRCFRRTAKSKAEFINCRTVEAVLEEMLQEQRKEAA